MPDSASRDDQQLRHQHHRRHPGHGAGTTTMLPDRYEPFKRLAMIQVHPPPNPNKPLTPFSITDILNGRTRRPERRNGDTGATTGGAISALSPGSVHFPAANSRLFRSHVIRTRTPAPDAKAFLRPWDDVTSPSNSTSDDNDEEIEIDEEKPPQDKSVSPLDALFQMTSKTFDGRTADGSLQPDGSRREQLNLFAKAQPAKKRRKSRTAFTNQQIYELEKRFLYQKYLTPADRDEIAQNLGLTNAQVITWFQNRRAKLKRDLEELKADVTAAKHLSDDDSVLPGVAQIDEIQLFNKHGLKRVEKKPSQTVSGVSTTISNSNSSITSSTTSSTTSTTSGAPPEGAIIPEARQSERTLPADGRRSDAHAQSPTVGACASALGSPDSTTHPTEGAPSSAPEMDRPNDPDCDKRREKSEPEVDEADDDDDDDEDEEIDV